jgi:hypothetical protein
MQVASVVKRSSVGGDVDSKVAIISECEGLTGMVGRRGTSAAQHNA